MDISKKKKSLKELLEIYPEWVVYIKFFEGIATKDMQEDKSHYD